MPAKAKPIFPSEAKILSELGQRLYLARMRRQFSTVVVAARAGISRPTLSRAEHGDPAVTLGTYLKILRVLQLDQDLNAIAQADVLGRRLQDARDVERGRREAALVASPSKANEGHFRRG